MKAVAPSDTKRPETELETLFRVYKQAVEFGGETQVLEARRKIKELRERADRK